MNFLKVARLGVPATALLVGCTSRQAAPSAKELGSEFIAAH
jgi:hypothetical protein